MKKSIKRSIKKVSTHIEQLDNILQGGFPAGRTTIISGDPGTGKSVLGLESLYREALSRNPGILLAFEETGECIRQNALSLGWNMAALAKRGGVF